MGQDIRPFTGNQRTVFLVCLLFATTAANMECDNSVSKACGPNPSRRDPCSLCPSDADICCKCLSFDLYQSGECENMVWWTTTTAITRTSSTTVTSRSSSTSSTTSGTSSARSGSSSNSASSASSKNNVLSDKSSAAKFDKDKCKTAADVIIIVDTSSSVTETPGALEQEKAFARDLSEAMRNMFNGVHLGVIGFGPVKEYLPLGNASTEMVGDTIRSIGSGTPTTPTKDALMLAGQMFKENGREDVAHIVFLITDGEPYPYYGASDREMVEYYFATDDEATELKDKGVQIVTIGVGLETSHGLNLMTSMASTPAALYAHEDVTGFDVLGEVLPEIVLTSCYYVESIHPACGPNGTWITVSGFNLFDSGKLGCRFQFEDETFLMPGVSINTTTLRCQVPAIPDHLAGVIGSLEVTIDQLAYTNNNQLFQFKSANDESPCLSLLTAGSPLAESSNDWLWLLLLIPLLLLACCLFFCFRRRKGEKRERVPVEEPYKSVAGPPVAPSIDEPLKLEPAAPVAAPATAPEGRFKWLVTPSAYIGFGKAKMDVNWNGEAPTSAPHAIKRKKSMEDLSADQDQGKMNIEKNAANDLAGSESSGMPGKQGCLPWLPWSWFCCGSAKGASAQPSKSKAAAASETRKTSLSSVQLHLPPRLVEDQGHGHPSSSAVSAKDESGSGDRKYVYASRDSSVSEPSPTPTPTPTPGPVPPQAAALPSGWEALVTEEGRTYYENRDLQITQWEKP